MYNAKQYSRLMIALMLLDLFTVVLSLCSVPSTVGVIVYRLAGSYLLPQSSILSKLMIMFLPLRKPRVYKTFNDGVVMPLGVHLPSLYTM